MSVQMSLPNRSIDKEQITAADIVAWAKVERALTAKREACSKSSKGKMATR
jgi:hypothetical protein